MRARHKLNVKQIAALSTPGVYSDGAGLYLRVRPTGSRSWLFIYTLHGRRREMGLGSDLDVSLAKAREKAAVAREQVLRGEDPLAIKAAPNLANENAVTFGQFALEFLDGLEAGFRNDKHRQQWRNTLKTYAVELWPVPINDVSTEHVLSAVQPIWNTKPETASRVRGRIERVLDAAKAKKLRTGENPAAWRGHLDLFLAKRAKGAVKHHAALSFGQVASFVTELRNRSGVAARALEFTILTAARSGETRGMTWAEVDHDEDVWTIPAARMKAAALHQVPLSSAAKGLLATIGAAEAKPSDLVFAAPRGAQLSDMAMAQLLRRMGRHDITVHGFRSTFRDWAGETTKFDREEIEMALAHTVQSATERAYRRGRALEKRRELMAAWAEYCAPS